MQGIENAAAEAQKNGEKFFYEPGEWGRETYDRLMASRDPSYLTRFVEARANIHALRME